jgi:hypothetical protein
VLAALDVATEESPQILVSDIRLAGTAGRSKLPELARHHHDGVSDLDSAVMAFQVGAS